MSIVRVRFAPSPTGYLHIGSLRTALFNWLWARKNGGQFILRIEDTDRSRYVEGAVENIIEALRWYGLDVDEGPIFQSERLDVYREHAQLLVDRGSAYYCFCSEERLDGVRKMQEANRQPTRYDGLCRHLSPDEAKKKFLSGEAHVVRLKAPVDGTTAFDDMIRGRVEVANATLDDTVLLKSDGFPTYHLANVVDDHEEGITHVIRAEEWLPSTPRHVILYAAFGWSPPVYAHPAMVLGTDRSKLSKRHGATSALEYREMGYLPEAVLNFIALLGWNPKNDRELFSRDELVKEFDLVNLNKSGAIFNVEKLDWLNGQYIRKMSPGSLAELCHSWLPREATGFDMGKVVALFQDRMKKLSDIKDASEFLFVDKLGYLADLLIPKDGTRDETVAGLELAKGLLTGMSDTEWTTERMRSAFETAIKEKGLTNKGVLWPLRVAMTGMAQSPGVFEVMDVLGRETSLRRLDDALTHLK